jgi:hypothetical protein
VSSQINSSAGQESQTALDKRVGFANKITTSFSQSKSVVDEDIQKSSPPSNVVNQLPQRSISEPESRQVHIIEQKTKPYWETGDGSSEDWNQYQPEGLMINILNNSSVFLHL